MIKIPGVEINEIDNEEFLNKKLPLLNKQIISSNLQRECSSELSQFYKDLIQMIDTKKQREIEQ